MHYYTFRAADVLWTLSSLLVRLEADRDGKRS